MKDTDRKLLRPAGRRRGYALNVYPADAVWLCSLAAMFVVCLELFYRMTVNFNHKYPSDLYYYAVTNVKTQEEHGRLIGELFTFLAGINNDIIEIVVFLAFLIVGIIIVNYATIWFFIKDDGCSEKVPRYAMQFCSVAMLFMGSIYVPFIFERYYKHTFKAFAWHSPTQQAMTFFALIASLCFLKMYLSYEEKGINAGWWLGTALFSLLAACSKPAFTIDLAPAIVVMFIADLIRGGRKDFGARLLKLFIMGCSFIPGGLYTLWLHNQSFTEGAQYGEEHAVIIDFAHVLNYDNLAGAIIFGTAIPIVVFAVNHERFRDKKYRFAGYIFAAGMLQWLLFDETGRRAKYGNFTWGRMYGIYYITLAAVCVALEIYYDKDGKFAEDSRKRTIYLIILGIVIAASVLSQLNYFRLILTGHGYQL